MRAVRSILLALFVLITGVSFAYADDLDKVITAEMKRQNVPGLAIGITKEGKISRLSNYGLANLEWQAPVGPDTLFQTGSTGKQFTSLAILMLEQEGKLSIEDPIRKFFPDAPASWADIRLKHLLSHTSGLDDENVPVNPQQTYSADALLQLIYQAAKSRPSGIKWAYSNSGYVMLGLIIEKVTGAPYHDYFTSHIFKPLGMKATRDISERDIIPGRAAGYERDEPKLDAPLKNRSWISPTFNRTADGSTYITARDFATYLAAIDAPSAPFGPLWAQTKVPVIKPDAAKPAFYAMGWFTVTVEGTKIDYHSGNWQGFNAYIIHWPQQKTGVVILANSYVPEFRDLVSKVVAAAAPGLPLPPR